VIREFRGLQGRQARKVWLDYLELMGPKGLRVSRGILENKVSLDYQALTVQQDHRV
jgi:hypothetical protein